MMDAPLHSATLFSAAAVTSLISAVWEGAALAVLVAVVLRFLPRLSAASRALVWMNVFALLFCLHFVPVFAARPSGAWAAAAQPAPIDLDLRWSVAVAAVWVVLSLYRAIQLILGAVRVHGLGRRATPMMPDEALRPLLATGPRGRAAELCVSSEVERPSVVGFFRPRILLPPALAESLTPQELEQVVLHEMEHLRRADDWTNLLQKIALVLFPLNPALLWVERRVCAERELACDDRVLLSCGARKAYAICLTRLAEFALLRRGFSLVLGAWERRPELARRVHRLLRKPPAAMTGLQAKLATAGVMVAVLGAGLALGRSPQMVAFADPSSKFAADSAQRHGFVANGAAMRDHAFSEADQQPYIVQAKAVIPEPMNTAASASEERAPKAKPAKVRAAVHKISPKYAVGQDWIVLTEWTDATLPPAAVVTVKFDPRGSYAAVRTVDGWLIVQI